MPRGRPPTECVSTLSFVFVFSYFVGSGSFLFPTLPTALARTGGDTVVTVFLVTCLFLGWRVKGVFYYCEGVGSWRVGKGWELSGAYNYRA